MKLYWCDVEVSIPFSYVFACKAVVEGGGGGVLSMNRLLKGGDLGVLVVPLWGLKFYQKDTDLPYLLN